MAMRKVGAPASSNVHGVVTSNIDEDVQFKKEAERPEPKPDREVEKEQDED